jgi:hypothetical protein
LINICESLIEITHGTFNDDKGENSSYSSQGNRLNRSNIIGSPGPEKTGGSNLGGSSLESLQAGISPMSIPLSNFLDHIPQAPTIASIKPKPTVVLQKSSFALPAPLTGIYFIFLFLCLYPRNESGIYNFLYFRRPLCHHFLKANIIIIIITGLTVRADISSCGLWLSTDDHNPHATALHIALELNSKVAFCGVKRNQIDNTANDNNYSDESRSKSRRRVSLLSAQLGVTSLQAYMSKIKYHELFTRLSKINPPLEPLGAGLETGTDRFRWYQG